MNALKLSKFRTEGRILGVARPVVGGSSAADLAKVKVVANKWDRIETDVTSDTKRFNPVEDDKKTIGSSGMVWENQVNSLSSSIVLFVLLPVKSRVSWAFLILVQFALL